MKIYYSNLNSVTFTEEDNIKNLGVLCSYATEKKVNKPFWADKYFLDSGAFTAYNSGKEINLTEYIKFIYTHTSKLDVYAALDVIGNPEKTFENYKIMKSEGLNPLPCFHAGSDKKYLRKYVKETNYIALGKMAYLNKKGRLNFLEDIFSLFPNVDEIGFHGFGMQDEEYILKYPWKTVDASSVHMQARYGGIYTPWGWLKVNPNVKSSNLGWQTLETKEIMTNYIKELNCDPDKIIKADSEGIKERCKVSIHYFEKIAKKVPTVFKKNEMSLF